MSKLQTDLVEKAIDNIFTFSEGGTVTKEGEELKGKKRNFVETIELQVPP